MMLASVSVGSWMLRTRGPHRHAAPGGGRSEPSFDAFALDEVSVHQMSAPQLQKGHETDGAPALTHTVAEEQGAMVALRQQALAESAARQNERGPLWGVLIAMKDGVVTAYGITTTLHSRCPPLMRLSAGAALQVLRQV